MQVEVRVVLEMLVDGKVVDRREINSQVPAAMQAAVSGPRRSAGPGPADSCADESVSATRTPVGMRSVLFDADGLIEQLDLLNNARLAPGTLEFAAAIRALFEGVVPRRVQLLRRKSRALVPGMPRLPADLSLAPLTLCRFGPRLDNVAGRRLRRRGRVLFEPCVLHLQRLDAADQLAYQLDQLPLAELLQAVRHYPLLSDNTTDTLDRL